MFFKNVLECIEYFLMRFVELLYFWKSRILGIVHTSRSLVNLLFSFDFE